MATSPAPAGPNNPTPYQQNLLIGQQFDQSGATAAQQAQAAATANTGAVQTQAEAAAAAARAAQGFATQQSEQQGIYGSLMSGLSGSSGALGGLKSAIAPTVSMPGGSGGAGGSGAPTVAPVDTSGATSAAFGAAKDQTGLETSGALTGLRSALGGRGMLGSGAEIGGTTSAINMGQQQLGAASRANATTQATQAETNALANQGAAVTSRGQDVTAEGNLYSGLVAQRGQDIAAQEAANTLASQQAISQATLRQDLLTGLMGAVIPKATAAY
jgi:hypothetical protein